MNISTVTIPLWEYKLMEKRIERKKDEVIYFFSGYYYWNKKQKELLEQADKEIRLKEEEIQYLRKNTPIKVFPPKIDGSEQIEQYEKAISFYRLAIWVLATTIIIILFI